MTDHIDKPPFKVVQIFTVEATLRHRGEYLARPANIPHAPQQIGVSMGLQHASDDKVTLVSVTLETTPNDGDEKALYDFSVQMLGIVEDVDRKAFDDRQLLEVVATIMFPFMRETVANLTGRGRFGPVWINPFNIRGAVQTGPDEPDSEVK